MSVDPKRVSKDEYGTITGISSIFAEPFGKMSGPELYQEYSRLIGSKGREHAIRFLGLLAHSIPNLAPGVHQAPHKEFQRCYAPLVTRFIKEFDQTSLREYSSESKLHHGLASQSALFFHWLMCEVAAQKGVLSSETFIMNTGPWEVDVGGECRATEVDYERKPESLISYYHIVFFPMGFTYM